MKKELRSGWKVKLKPLWNAGKKSIKGGENKIMEVWNREREKYRREWELGVSDMEGGGNTSAEDRQNLRLPRIE